ncbi:hypothetical protein PIB30_083133 [Stylosanthes scabra]|uniref:Uncharacterized protein n=1 Tax=Stylosanthes scabra TaxID=79078 RepID=A0ABU6ZRI3_9FABA|nr:hypothetical protein [Stylosanthes scabra]
MDQTLNEVSADLCISGATWKLSLGQPVVPIQLRRTKLHPLAKGWQEFIIYSLVPMGNQSEITIARAILIHSIMRGEEVRAEDITADNMADAGVPLREFRRTSKILEEKYITAKWMESTRIPRNLPQQQQGDDDEDEPMPQPGYESQYHEDLQGIEEQLSSLQFLQQSFYENMQKSQADYMEKVKQIKEKQEEMWNNNNRFQYQFIQEQERLAREIQEVRKSKLSQTLVNNKRLETEKNLQQAVERQGRDIAEMRKPFGLGILQQGKHTLAGHISKQIQI